MFPAFSCSDVADIIDYQDERGDSKIAYVNSESKPIDWNWQRVSGGMFWKPSRVQEELRLAQDGDGKGGS